MSPDNEAPNAAWPSEPSPTPEQAWDYEAFISYSHKDSRWARWLHKGIETYRIPARLRTERGVGARIGRLFLDRSELPSSSSLADTIKSAMARSRCLVVICSPASAASRWVNEEIRLFRAMGRGDRIFCLVVDGIPGSTDPATQAFPPALLENERGEIDPGVEPLAADVRPNQDRPGDAKLKIMAGLLDVSFDDLRQRQAARRQRQLLAVAGVSLALMLVMLGLTIAAVLARNEAQRQTLTALRTTDFLRSLFEDSDPDETRGAQLTAREMLDRGTEKLGKSSDLKDQPAVRASLLTTLAEVYSKLGLYRSADRLVRTAETLPGRDAKTRAQAALVIARVSYQNSDYARGERALATALADVGGDTPSRIKLLLEQGELFKAAGKADAAETVLQEVRRLALAQTPPDRDHAIQALASLGANDFESGNAARAVPRLRAVVAQRTALSGPLHTEVQFALNTLGTVAIKQGDQPAAERYFRRTLALQRRVLGESHPYVAITEGNLGRALVEQRRFAEAARLIERALATLSRNNDPMLDSLANLYDTLGLAQTGLGRAADAEASFAKGLRVANFHKLTKEGELYIDLAELRCATRRPADGLAVLDRASAVYAANEVTEDWRKARWASVKGGCLFAAGDRAAARPLILDSEAAIGRRWGANSLFGVNAARLTARLAS